MPTNDRSANGQSRKTHAARKPYAMVGAGQLASSIWKTGDERAGWRYRFNVFRMSAATGRVSQRLTPGDVVDLVKLARVLAAALADDGCIAISQRQVLLDLAADIDQILRPVE